MDGRRGLKERRLRSMTKCQMCGKKFMTVQALKVHEVIHKTKAKAIVKKVLGSRVVKQKAVISQRKSVAKKVDVDKEVNIESKITFKCPKCPLAYERSSEVVDHIKEEHCVDDKDEPVSENSPNRIKPVSLRCSPSEMPINSQAPTCLNTSEVNEYKCLGCSQSHHNLYFFDQHLSRMHSDGVESMFFPTEIDFLSWKQSMEVQTRATYSTTLKDYTEKQIYKCHRQETVDGVRQMCPSSIITQKFANGIQVHFYKKHYSHSVRPYQISVKFKKYSITNFVRVQDKKKAKEVNKVETDLYVQFKQVIEGIVLDAAKINIPSLKILLEKAYEMTRILNNYNEDDEQDVPMDRPLLDDQITLALEDNTKRKLDSPSPTPEKKSKTEGSETEEVTKEYEIKAKKRVYQKKIADLKAKELTEEIEEEEIEKKEISPITSTPKPKKIPLIQSPSFNDTYKNFVDVNFKTVTDDKTITKPHILKNTTMQVKKKPGLKTKMGQFKPSFSPKNSTSPLNKSDDAIVKFRDVKEVEYEVKERDNDCNILILKF